MSIGSTLPAWLALGLSVASLWFQFVPNYFRLKGDISHLHVVKVAEDKYLILLRLSLLNNSSKGMVVYNILPTSTPKSVTVEEVEWKFDLENQIAECKSSMLDANSLLKIPISELLLRPLDIPPRRVVSKWVGLILSASQDGMFRSRNGEYYVSLNFEGVNISGSQLVYFYRNIYPLYLTPNITYDLLRSQFPPKFKDRVIYFLKSQNFALLVLTIIIFILFIIWIRNLK